ncbi:hypothetical protein E2C01_047300 [Portunus trituberculatus]|uniref:Uncharacterized protein n=1 Tax=Portunus trituberculatus TaxID=210409 RepID=A0A5B7G034_PORTR|nr:hypothetical protein [Portunus trituberculatus]
MLKRGAKTAAPVYNAQLPHYNIPKQNVNETWMKSQNLLPKLKKQHFLHSIPPFPPTPQHHSAPLPPPPHCSTLATPMHNTPPRSSTTRAIHALQAITPPLHVFHTLKRRLCHCLAPSTRYHAHAAKPFTMLRSLFPPYATTPFLSFPFSPEYTLRIL